MAFQEPFVDKCPLQLVLARHGESGVIDYWWRPHSPNPLVEPVGRIFSRHVVDCQLHLESSQHLVVLGLTQIVEKFGLVDIAIVLLVKDVDFHLVKKVLPIGDMLGRGTRE